MAAVTDYLRQLHQKPIMYCPIYIDIMGSIYGGIALAQLIEWFTEEGDGFFKTNAEIRKATRLSERELQKTKKKLKELSFLTITIKGLPASTYYEINWVDFGRYLEHFVTCE